MCFLGRGVETQELFCTGPWPKNLVRDFILSGFSFESCIREFIYSVFFFGGGGLDRTPSHEKAGGWEQGAYPPTYSPRAIREPVKGSKPAARVLCSHTVGCKTMPSPPALRQGRAHRWTRQPSKLAAWLAVPQPFALQSMLPHKAPSRSP